jgi:hypothetical protein
MNRDARLMSGIFLVTVSTICQIFVEHALKRADQAAFPLEFSDPGLLRLLRRRACRI